MIVDDFDFVHMAFSLDGTDTPFIADADRVLSLPLAAQRL